MGIGHQGGEEAGQVVVAGVLAVFLISKQPEQRRTHVHLPQVDIQLCCSPFYRSEATEPECHRELGKHHPYLKTIPHSDEFGL